MKKLLFVGIVVLVMLVIAGNSKKTESQTKTDSLAGNPSYNCQSGFKVGFKVINIPGGPKTAVWYPTSDKETTFEYYKGVESSIAQSGNLETSCGKFPLVIFSHAYGGCGIQSIFFTEQLARQGYIVAGPDHNDALCSVDGKSAPKFGSAPSLLEPNKWTDSTYIDRKNDVIKVIDNLTNINPIYGKQISKIGLVGHSLGGYTALGLSGGWKSWQDNRIEAALLLSPYSLPFSVNKTLGNVEVPLMYQGADFDIGITPFIEGPEGAYGQSNAPKYFAKLRAGNHFIWTNLECVGYKMISDCLKSDDTAKLIDYYGIAFLDKYLRGIDNEILQNGQGLSTYQYKAF